MNRTEDTWDGKKYENNSDPQSQCAVSALETCSFKGSEKVLDIGCGDGRITARISGLVTRGAALGIDPSLSMIEQCLRNYSGIPNLSFRVAEVSDLTCDRKFDLAVSFSAFHWIEDQAAALRKIQELLEPCGGLIIRMAGGQQPEIAEVFNKDCWKNMMPVKQRRFHGKTDAEFSVLLKQCGFVVEQCEVLFLSQFFKNQDELLSWIMAWAPHATGLTGNTLVDFAKDIVAGVCEAQNSGPGIELKSPMLFVKASKPII